eukprot:gnl/MRDRNA2_/MRDRNA2_91293_c0_seq1.p1 gnl/MRDRNA2_/MRDRNA2_91293_c0~~gnl/MRDRNA2_/MRDRNA2_91293_c0_seq1.p1  ORF type:complete len:711 (+),score=228.91 gnl/MRDRNA2_/MRDRNA2_91293_c0_seq1:76-2208(+)
MQAILMLFALHEVVNAAHLHQHQHMHGNPIRKVVVMLQDMQKSVEEEIEKEKELFEAFICHCQSTSKELAESIESGTAKSSTLSASIESNTAQISQLSQDITGHKEDRASAEKEVQESTALRQKEEAEFGKVSGEMKANIDSLTSALGALKSGVSPAALLQTNVANVLRTVAARSSAVSDEDRSVLSSLLDASEGDAAPGTDQIIGIVDQMLEEMSEDLKEVIGSEEERKASFEALIRAKTKEIAAATRAVETKMERSGNLAVANSQDKDAYEDTEETLKTDTEMQAGLKKSCELKTKEQEIRTKTQADEISAISEAIKLLNDDDALELFKKTLPGPASLLQTSSKTHMHARVHQALHFFRQQMARDPRNAAQYRSMLIATREGAKGHSGKGFDKVLQMIDGMILLLGKEQTSDDEQKDFCIEELDKTEDNKKSLEGTIADISGEISKTADEIAEVTAEIDTLKQGILALDKSVGEATEQRKSEHAEHLSTAAANQAAVKLLGMAKNMLNRFYNPEEYRKPEPTPEPAGNKYLSLEQEPMQPTQDDGIIFAQVRMRTKQEEPDVSYLQNREPERAGAAGGVLGMMSQLQHSVELDIKESEMEEADAQKDYEEAMKAATSKRAADSELIVTKDTKRAQLTAVLEDQKGKKSLKVEQLDGVAEKLGDLHSSCDQLLETYDDRKKARAAQSEGLKNSKAVLNGASFSLAQRHP